MNTIKDRLAKTAIPVEKREILNALGVVNIDKMDRLTNKEVYPPQKNLLNNPFFPKHLYQNKPKKKKNNWILTFWCLFHHFRKPSFYNFIT